MSLWDDGSLIFETLCNCTRSTYKECVEYCTFLILCFDRAQRYLSTCITAFVALYIPKGFTFFSFGSAVASVSASVPRVGLPRRLKLLARVDFEWCMRAKHISEENSQRFPRQWAISPRSPIKADLTINYKRLLSCSVRLRASLSCTFPFSLSFVLGFFCRAYLRPQLVRYIQRTHRIPVIPLAMNRTPPSGNNSSFCYIRTNNEGCTPRWEVKIVNTELLSLFSLFPRLINW